MRCLQVLLLLTFGRSDPHNYEVINVLRNRTCLANAIAWSDRRNLSIGGVSRPLMLGMPGWDSAYVEAFIFRILVEDIFGIHVEITDFYGDTPVPDLIQATADCRVHLAIGIWDGEESLELEEDLKRYHGDKFPIQLGTMGYDGYGGLYVREDVMEAAMEEHLPLNFYLSYSNPRVDFMQFFDRPEDVDTSSLRQSCWYDDRERLAYEAATGDNSSACIGESWWISPACRLSPSKCIPAINLWDETIQIKQYAFWWNMPLAVASSDDWYAYFDLLREARVIFFAYTPDGVAVGLNKSRLVFPPYNGHLWHNGIFKTQMPSSPIRKLACRQLERRNSESTAQLTATLGSMRLLEEDILDLVNAIDIDLTPEHVEATACKWLHATKVPWKNWLASSTVCQDGQGIAADNGTFVNSRGIEATRCMWCSPGRKSVGFSDAGGWTYRCEKCDAGQFQGLMAAASCKLCAEGKFAAQSGASTCHLCPRGRFATERGRTWCNGCRRGLVTAQRGATIETACICPEGYLRPGPDVEDCQTCPEGMMCPHGPNKLMHRAARALQAVHMPILKAGFWSSREEPLQVFRCDSDFKCPGNRVPGTVCAEHLEGQGCAHCEAGYYWDGNMCGNCDHESLNIAVPLLLLMASPILACVSYWCCVDEYTDWNRWYHGAFTSMFIILNFYQITNVIRQANLKYSEEVTRKFEWFALVSDIVRLFHLDCHGMKSFGRQLLMQSLAPLLALLIYIATWGISQLVALRYPRVRMCINRTMNAFMSLMLALFGGIVDSAFAIFKCGSNPSGVYTLLKDRSVNCYEDEWASMRVIGIMSLLFWCVGFVLIMAWAIYRAPQSFHEEAQQRRWRFLFIRYRPDVHWWALTFVAKSVLVNVGCQITSSGLGQIYWIMATILAYTYLTAIFRPWRHPFNSDLDLWVNVCLFVVCTSTAWFAREASIDPDEGDRLANLVLTISLCGVATPIFFTNVWQCFQSIGRGEAKLERVMQGILKSTATLSEASSSDIRTFLKEMTYVDMQLMIRATHLIQTELAHERSGWRHGYSAHMLRQARERRMAKLCIAGGAAVCITNSDHSVIRSCSLDAFMDSGQPDLNTNGVSSLAVMSF